MRKKEVKKLLKKVWYFIWEDNSIWSWVVNIVLAFVLIKFIVYPGLGLLLATSHPVVAVVSSSMEHKSVRSCVSNGIIDMLRESSKCNGYKYTMCGNTYDKKKSFGLDEYWEYCGGWYKENGITREGFSGFSYKNGFNKGDIMVLRGVEAEKISTGDVIVFFSKREDPIIHRVVEKGKKGGKIYFHTKGDNNEGSIRSTALDETNVSEDVVIGKAVLRVPLLGYVKIWFVEILKALGFIP